MTTGVGSSSSHQKSIKAARHGQSAFWRSQQQKHFRHEDFEFIFNYTHIHNV
jgi:hypothetical protein